MFKLARKYGCASLLLAIGTACSGGAAGPDYDPPYAMFHAAITAAQVPVSGPEVRVALVWSRAEAHRDQPVLVAQDIGVTTQFPVHFTLNVTQLPPEDAMNPLFDESPSEPTPGAMSVCISGCTPQLPPPPKGLKMAYGTIIVYEDTNGNGRLDLITEPNSNSPDRVLGIPRDIIIQYLEGGMLPAPYNGLGIQPGYNLIQGGDFGVPPDLMNRLSAGQHLGCFALESPYRRIDVSTEIEIELTQDPTLNRYLCAEPSGDTPSSIAGSGCIGGLGSCPLSLPPASVAVTCSADNRAFETKTCTQTGGVCGSTACIYTCGVLADGTMMPADWPCH